MAVCVTVDYGSLCDGGQYELFNRWSLSNDTDSGSDDSSDSDDDDDISSSSDDNNDDNANLSPSGSEDISDNH